MSFLHPEFLYYMLPPLFILFGFLLTQKETQAHFFSEEVMDKLRVSANTLTLKARNALFLIIGFFIIIALAQPVIDDGKVIVKAKSADIMIALDISDSMLAEDVYPNRLELAKQKALSLLVDAPDERVGIMAFAKNSYLVSPLSFDTKAVSFLLTQLDTTSITQKGTDFLSILDVFSKSQNSDGEKYLLILSDGGDSSDFSKEIEVAKKSNIVVFVLGIGTTKGAPIRLQDGSFIKQNGEVIVSKLNENISELATSSGGVYIQSTISSSDVSVMLKEIKSISKEKELKSEEVHKFIPLFYFPVGMALFLLLIATSSMSKRVKVDLPSLLFLSLLIHASVELEAGILDFIKLQDAKEAYNSQNYEKSAKLYEKYAEDSKKAEGYFNTGNSMYKQHKYKEALESYKKATFEDDSLRAKNFANMGNAHAKGKNLQKAVELYEKSLKIQEDKETKENLEIVRKLLKKQKKQKQDSKKSDNKNKDKDKDNKDESQGSKESDKDDKSKKEEDSSKSKGSKDKKQSKDDMNTKKDNESKTKDKKNDKSEKDKKEQLDKLDKDDNKKSSDIPKKAQDVSQEEMSDAEEAKWLQQLNLQKNTYLYKMGKQKPMKEYSDEKPW